MRKVMIVDDESLVRIGLQSMIDWESHGYTIAGVFKNGEDALSAAKELHYDIVLTDIRMPGMSGLELVAQLQTVSPQSNVIILSSYNDFEYTRKAIQLGVKDYISKYELEPDELFRVLDSLAPVPQAEHAAEQLRSPTEQSLLLQEFQKLLLQTRSYDSKADTAADRSAANYPQLEAKLHQAGCRQARWIAIRPEERSSQIDRKLEEGDWRVLHVLLAEEFAQSSRLLLLGHDSNRMHGLFTISEHETDQTLLHQLSDKWQATCLDKLNLQTTIFWSEPFAAQPFQPEVMAINRKHATELEQISFYESDKSCFIVENEPAMHQFSHEQWIAHHQLIRKRLSFCQFLGLQEDLAASLETEQNIAPAEWLRLYHLAAGQIANYLLQECQLSSSEIAQYFNGIWPLPEYIAHCTSKQTLLERFVQITNSTEQFMRSGTHTALWIAKVKDYVDEHYASALRLEDAAAHVHLSVNYFSQKFRQETGEGFNDFLTKIRIQEAIKLLRSTSLSTEEIANRVGYMNTNYFIKVFKKVTGFTLKDFKAQAHRL